MRRLVPLLFIFFALAETADAAWVWPVSGDVITPYRNGTDPYATGQHRGIDIAAPVGTPVVAAAGGDVRFAGTAGLLRADDLDPHRRRVRHLVPPPLLARRARRRARVGRATASGRSAPPGSARRPRPTSTSESATPEPATTTTTPWPSCHHPRHPPAHPTRHPQHPPQRPSRHRPHRHPSPAGAPSLAHTRRHTAAPWRPRAGCRTPPPITGRTPCRTACPTPFRTACRTPFRTPSLTSSRWPLRAPAPIRPRAPVYTWPRVRPHPRRATPRSAASGRSGPRAPRCARTPDSLRQSRRRQASAGGGFDLGWAAACAGLLLAAGLLGMTGGTRRRPPRLPGWAFFLAKWQGKTPNPAQRPRG